MNPAPRFLGLDLGTSTGYALSEGTKIIRSGVRDFTLRPGQHEGQRFIEFYNFLNGLWKDHGSIDMIFFEKVMFSGFRSGGKAWAGDGGELNKGLQAIMKMLAAARGIECHGVPVNTLKKNFAGYGHAEKADMCAAARAIGWRAGQAGTARFHDEADAIGLVVTEARMRFGYVITF